MDSSNFYRSIIYADSIFSRLQQHYGQPKPPLDHESNEQLAVAVILSAQCTDARVNIVTKTLFKKCPNLFALNNISLSELEKLIYSTGFYKNKAKNLKDMAKIVVEKYNGCIPNNFDILVNLPGIGRKTANVIMNQAFDTSIGIVVDTHVRRITQLLKLTNKKTPEQIEKDLMIFFPKKYWKDFPLYLVFLGREFCIARKPICQNCILNEICPSKK